jgi:SSS family solute:Na+ symporter/sodium/pantothenate symporter
MPDVFVPVAPGAGWGALATLFGVVVASVWLGTLAARAAARGRFLTAYFLGNRRLGALTLALTATVQSGGTFMGFPALVYSHGWVVALWIAPYMVIPLTGLAVLGKRIAQLSRRTGAVTVPDLFRARFASPALGLVSSLLIMFSMSFMMVAQFKAGALIMKVAWPGRGALSLAEEAAGGGGIDGAYYIGLALFTIVVVSYTVIGGFLAAVWTDLFQSVLMFAGVMILLPLALSAAGGMEAATRGAVAATDARFAWGPGYDAGGRSFLPPSLAVSSFFVLIFSGLASPAGMVRLMATRSAATVRRSVVLLAVYNMGIYLPLVVVCIAARSVLPRLAAPDEVIPRLALATTRGMPGGSILSGLILAAPFGAVMATVSAYLVVISSGIVRDVYVRLIRPEAGDAELRRLARLAIVAVGAVAVAANLRPVAYLQAIVVFASTTSAATFVVPAVMTAYWRRASAAGALAAMLTGSAVMIGLSAAGWVLSWRGFDPGIGPATGFRPYYLLGLEPVVWGLAASLAAGVGVSLLTSPPPAELIGRLFEEMPGAREASVGASTRVFSASRSSRLQRSLEAPTSIRQLRQKLGRTGLLPSAKVTLVRALPGEAPTIPGITFFGWVSKRAGRLVTDRRGRVAIMLTDDALSLLRTAVETVGHELHHIEAMRVGTGVSENAAEEAAKLFLSSFLRRLDRLE